MDGVSIDQAKDGNKMLKICIFMRLKYSYTFDGQTPVRFYAVEWLRLEIEIINMDAYQLTWIVRVRQADMDCNCGMRQFGCEYWNIYT